MPGNKSYAHSLAGNDVLVIGSSMLTRIRKKEFSAHVKNGNSRYKVFPGANTNRINYYLEPELRENNYKKVVIHVGTNDLFDKTADEILEGMQDIRETCLEHGVETIIFSGIVFRRCKKEIEEKRLTLNLLLREMCESVENVFFVNNDNIFNEDLYTDGLHLVETGTVKLANNILRCINGK